MQDCDVVAEYVYFAESVFKGILNVALIERFVYSGSLDSRNDLFPFGIPFAEQVGRGLFPYAYFQYRSVGVCHSVDIFAYERNLPVAPAS